MASIQYLYMTPIYKETFFLSAGETNAEQELSLPLLTAKLIDIATAHANELNIGNPDMRHLSAGWVLSRLTVEMYRYPKVNETYTLSTWVESFNRHFSERAFSISSENGEVLGYARSVWMVMHTITHTNVGLSHLKIHDDIIVGNKPPIDRQAKHIEIIESDKTNGNLTNTLPMTDKIYDFSFKYCDLDSYRHVNTVRYVTLLLNRFSLEQMDSTYVTRMELSFLHEGKYGVKTQLLRNDNNDKLISSFMLRRNEDLTPIFFARIFRQPRKES